MSDIIRLTAEEFNELFDQYMKLGGVLYTLSECSYNNGPTDLEFIINKVKKDDSKQLKWLISNGRDILANYNEKLNEWVSENLNRVPFRDRDNSLAEYNGLSKNPYKSNDFSYNAKKQWLTWFIDILEIEARKAGKIK